MEHYIKRTRGVTKKCSIIDCQLPYNSRGFCQKHYLQKRNDGSLKVSRKSNIPHTKHPLYSTYLKMRKRCYDEKHVSFPNYGGIGITVCDEWMERISGFENFLKDMGDKPSKSHTLDRIDVSLGYSKNNCRWSTIHIQCSNKRNNNKNVGVSYNNKTNTWKASIQVNKIVYSKTFKSEIEAILHRHNLEIQYLGDTLTNL